MKQHIIISRTDRIGDVILTLPIAAALRDHIPNVQITFLGNTYTKPVLLCSPHIDRVVEWDELKKLPEKERVRFLKNLNADAILHVFPDKHIARTALKAGIPLRAGTSHRVYHWLYCNSLLNIGRKRSELHETQLNFQLIRPFGINIQISPQQINSSDLLSNVPAIDEKTAALIDPNRINIILHPCSLGSAREWPVEHYAQLCNLLPEDRYHIIFSGTASEAERYRPHLHHIHRNFKDAGGLLSLTQYISLISSCDGLVAASTGPLHIAAACGIHAFGIYPPIRPMHPGRWAPLGNKSHVFVKDTVCNECRKTNECRCMQEILPEDVKLKITEVLPSAKVHFSHT